VIVHPIDIASSAILLFLSLGLLAFLLARSQRLMINICFSLAAIASFLGLAAGVWTVASGETARIVLLLGLPDLPFHLRLDPLAGFFLTVIGLLSFFVSVYSIGYVRGFIGKRSVTSLVIFYCLFIAGMFMVVMADDALIFLISWEMMQRPHTFSFCLSMSVLKTEGQPFFTLWSLMWGDRHPVIFWLNGGACNRL
jgi:formate hydrogenlyase subunit 3/multisubunit Na+/H+ antiporter MnhD subunit